MNLPFTNIYPAVFEGINKYSHMNGNLESFLVAQNLRVVKQIGDGHCFINCLRQYFTERFEMSISKKNIEERYKFYMKKDLNFLMKFMTVDSVDPNIGIKNLMNQLYNYFHNKEHTNNFTDILINTCTRYFSFKIIILEERDSFNMHIFSISNAENVEFQHEFQQFDGEFLVLLRSGHMHIGSRFSSHYDLLLPLHINAKSKIS